MNKHQTKTRETRELLLRSAEQIFVRDGYAGADLGVIATLAARTKGSIYAQFKSKEDLFMALVEEHALRYRAYMEDALAENTTIIQNREAFRQLCLKMAADKSWNILMLEFKLFAIRSATARLRYQQFISGMISPDDEMRLSQLIGVERIGKNALRRTVSVQLMQPLISAVTLEHLFDPTSIDKRTVKQVIVRVFNSIIGTPSSPEVSASADMATANAASKKPPSVSQKIETAASL